MRGSGKKENETKKNHGLEMTDLGEQREKGREELMVSIWLGMLVEKSNAGLLEEEEANKHMICRLHPGTETRLAAYGSDGKMQLRDTREHRLCEANDLCSSVRITTNMLVYCKYGSVYFSVKACNMCVMSV